MLIFIYFILFYLFIILRCTAWLLLDIVKRNESHFFVEKIKLERLLLLFFFCRWTWIVSCGRVVGAQVSLSYVGCWVYACVCCERGERRRWRERSEQRKNNVSIELARVLPSYVGQGLLKCDDRLPIITSLASWRPCVSEPKRRHWRASVGSGSSNARDERARFLFCFVFLFVVVWWRAVDGVCALLGAVCATRCCVRGSVLCARLDAVSAARALLTIFFLDHCSETRMLYFFALPIWLVAVTAQVTMNPADAAALNQTLTGLGCWQSSTCQTKNFSCGAGVFCNANGSVTSL